MLARAAFRTAAFRPAALAGLLALAACGQSDENALAELDNQLLANGADPALTSALEDQILVDPNLVQQAHPNMVRPPEAPVQAQYPAGSAAAEAGADADASGAGVRRAIAATAAAEGEGGDCAAAFEYGAIWAGRLPAEFPLYPGARLTEAAGKDSDGCRVRVVAFRTGDPHGRVLEHYRRLAARAGFSAEHRQRGADHMLGGVNARTDGAFVVIVTPLERGSDVALIVNNGG
jgi:hypothetical protein